MRARRGFLAIGLVLVAMWLGCAPRPRYDAAPGATMAGRDNLVVVENDNWWATAVEWHCNGSRIWTMRSLDSGRPNVAKLRLWPCQNVQFVVRGRGDRLFRSETFIVPEGTTVRVSVTPAMNLTTFWLRSEA
jgi:hypothetical protein